MDKSFGWMDVSLTLGLKKYFNQDKKSNFKLAVPVRVDGIQDFKMLYGKFIKIIKDLK